MSELYLEIRRAETSRFYAPNVVAAPARPVEVSGAVVGQVGRTRLTSVLLAADVVPAQASDVDVGAALKTSDGCETSARTSSGASVKRARLVEPVAEKQTRQAGGADAAHTHAAPLAQRPFGPSVFSRRREVRRQGA